MPKRLKKTTKKGGIFFIPSIISGIKGAIDSNNAHKQRLKAHRERMDRLRAECGPDCKFDEAELHRRDDLKQIALEKLKEEKMQKEVLNSIRNEGSFNDSALLNMSNDQRGSGMTVRGGRWVSNKPAKGRGIDPCWNGFEMHGTKIKNNKKVPNCLRK